MVARPVAGATAIVASITAAACVVRELNRLGVLVDISHVSDKTFYDVLETSRASVIASHSSCRALCDPPAT